MAAQVWPRSESNIHQTIAKTLRCFDNLDAGREITKEHEILYARFAVQRTRLVLWGQCQGLGAGKSRPITEESMRMLHELRGTFPSGKSLCEEIGLTSCNPSDLEGSRRLLSRASRGFELFKKMFLTYKRQMMVQMDDTVEMHCPGWQVSDIKLFSVFIGKLTHLIDALYQSNGVKVNIEETLEWRDRFYREMSIVAEEPDSLNLLVDGRFGKHDHFATYASQRLLDREGRPRPTFWKRYRILEDESDRFMFERWHKFFHSHTPLCLRLGVSEDPTISTATAASSEEDNGILQGHFVFCLRLGARHSDLCEIDLSLFKDDAELSREIRRRSSELWRADKGCRIRNACLKPASIRLIQFQTINGRVKVLARDSVPRPADFDSHGYYMRRVGIVSNSERCQSWLTPDHKATKSASDEEIQTDPSVFDMGQQLYDRLFKNSGLKDGPCARDLLPRKSRGPPVSSQAEAATGWGIEIIEGPSWIFNFFQLLPTLIAVVSFQIVIYMYGPHRSTPRWADHDAPQSVKSATPPIDMCLIAFGCALLVLILVKGSKMMEP